MYLGEVFILHGDHHNYCYSEAFNKLSANKFNKQHKKGIEHLDS